MIENFFKVTTALIGLGVLLHWYAFAIAWGIRRGQAKIASTVTVNLKSDK